VNNPDRTEPKKRRGGREGGRGRTPKNKDKTYRHSLLSPQPHPAHLVQQRREIQRRGPSCSCSSYSSHTRTSSTSSGAGGGTAEGGEAAGHSLHTRHATHTVVKEERGVISVCVR